MKLFFQKKETKIQRLLSPLGGWNAGDTKVGDKSERI